MRVRERERERERESERETAMRWCVPRVKASLEKRATTTTAVTCSRRLSAETWGRSSTGVEASDADTGEIQGLSSPASSYSFEGCTRVTPVLLLPVLLD